MYMYFRISWHILTKLKNYLDIGRNKVWWQIDSIQPFAIYTIYGEVMTKKSSYDDTHDSYKAHTVPAVIVYFDNLSARRLNYEKVLSEANGANLISLTKGVNN